MFNVIKDYLISIGMHVDKKSFQEADSAVKKVDQKLNKSAKSSGKSLATVAKAGTALVATVAVALGKMTLSVAEADRQMGFLARRLFTTKENARSLTIAMKQMHIASLEELREVALDPETKRQFLELKDLARRLENGNFQKSLKEIRELNFEFRKFMVRFEYLKIEIASNIAKWVKDVYPKIEPIINIIRSTTILAVKGWKAIFEMFKRLGDLPFFKKLDKWLRIFEDFMVYIAGGKSLYAPLWARFGFARNTAQNSRGYATSEEEIALDEQISRDARKQIKDQGNEKRSYKWGESVGGFRANRIDANGKQSAQDLVLSLGNVLYAQQLGSALGDVANKFRITSGWESGHSKNSKHHSGLAMDFGFRGTTLDERLKLIKAVLANKSTAQAFLEVNSQTFNQIKNQLEQEGGYQFGKTDKGMPYIQGSGGARMMFKESAAEHLHTENKPYKQVLANQPIVMQNNFNIQSPDPKETAVEVSRNLNLEFNKGGIHP